MIPTKKIKILHILTYINGGGAGRVVFNYLSNMNRVGIDFDIAAIDMGKKQFQEDDFRRLGVNIIYVPKNTVKRIAFFYRLISNGKYDIIHSHCLLLSEIYMLFAIKANVKTRIIHSHLAEPNISFTKRLYSVISHFISKLSANYFFACGIDAAISAWGKQRFGNDKCIILNNAIDIGNFKFSEGKRCQIRTQMNWNNKFVIVNVGRFNYQKNHIFLIKIFREIYEINHNAILALIGDGELRPEIERQIEQYGIKNETFLLGNCSNVSDILNACDVFVLPSLFEGLPIVSIESQSNGLPIVMSDTITKECGITNISFYLSLNDDVKTWARYISNIRRSNSSKYADLVKESGFEISSEADKLREFYFNSLM